MEVESSAPGDLLTTLKLKNTDRVEWGENAPLKGVIWCDFKFCFLFGVLQAVRA